MVGVIFGRESARIIAVGPQAGGMAKRAQAAMPWRDRAKPEARGEFLRAAAGLLQGLGADHPPAWISIPSREAALHVVALAPSRLDWLFPPPPPPLERLTPLKPEAVRLAVRRAAPAVGGGAGLGQAAVVRGEVVEEALALAREAGLNPRALDLRAGVAAAAGANLVSSREPGLFILLHQAGVEWSYQAGGRPGLIGDAERRPAEGDARLATHACQMAIQLCGLTGDFHVTLAGAGAGEAAEALRRAARQSQGPRPLPRVLEADKVLPPGLEWEELAMYAFLAGGKGRPKPTFNLLPQTAATWLDRPAAAKRLGLAAAGVFALWAVVGLGGAWLAKAGVESRLEDARARLSRLKSETRQVRSRLGGVEYLARASQARGESASLLTKAAGFLPPGAWLERLEFNGGQLVLYAGGVAKAKLAGLLPKSGLYSPVQPLREVSAPGSGRAAVKAVLALEENQAAAQAQASAPGKSNGKPSARGRAPYGKPPRYQGADRPLYTPGLPNHGQ